jgi:hypothetical protein
MHSQVVMGIGPQAMGAEMAVALEINFAGWGMLICAALKLVQFYEMAF